MIKVTIPKLFLLVILFITISYSCKKEGIQELPNAKHQLQRNFSTDSLNFYKDFDKRKYNFRQSLQREILWKLGREVNHQYVVPVNLFLPEGQIDPSTGTNIFNLKTYLIIDQQTSDASKNYKLLTLIPDDKIRRTNSGYLIIEDYFTGKVEHANYYNKGKDRLEQAAENNKLAGYGTGCDFVKIGDVCVGDPSSVSYTDVCSERYEYKCNTVSGDLIDFTPIFDGETGGPSTGGGGSETTYYTTLAMIAPDYKIDLKKRLDCFKNIPDNANTKYNVILNIHNVSNTNIKPGHAYITFEKSNGNQIQRLNFGFYPQSSLHSVTFLPVESAIGEESQDYSRLSDARYNLFNITKERFDLAISTALQLASEKYDLDNNNCVHFATNLLNALNPPSGTIDNSMFLSPNVLYDKLRSIKDRFNAPIDFTSKKPDPSTACN